MNPKSFILGLVLAGLSIFAIAADNHRPVAWTYQVVEKEVKYATPFYYTEAINQSMTNGWDFVSAQITTQGREVFGGAKVLIILKQPKK